MLVLATLPGSPTPPASSLAAAFDLDRRRHKIDLASDLYLDSSGATPPLEAVLIAKTRQAEQRSESSAGAAPTERAFVDAVADLVFTANDGKGHRAGLQTPGGVGALRVAAEFAKRLDIHRIHVGLPVSPQLVAVLEAGGLEVVSMAAYDRTSQRLVKSAWMTALQAIPKGEAVYLPACGSDPSGLSLDPKLWQWTTRIMIERELVPLVDIDGLGLGDGVDEDGAGARLLLRSLPYALIAFSGDHTFGLYEERVGALYVQAPNPARSAALHSNLIDLARASWSPPSSHGASLVTEILSSEALRALWMAEIAERRVRLNRIRDLLSASHARLTPVRIGRGLFTTVNLVRHQIERLRLDHAIYVPTSRRLNVSGLNPSTIERFARALRDVA